MANLNNIFKKSKFFNKKYISLILILFIIFLGTPTVAKATVFEPSSMDKSIEYLTAIFGNKINNRLISEDSIQVNTFLANLFQIFNTVVLSIAILILAYIAIISTLNTAQEGQVMGKKWSSVWIPLRSSMGLLMLAPLPGTGYSSLQVIVMWIVLNGVGAADFTWNFVLTNLSQGISISQKEQLNTESLNNINNQSQELAKSLFNSLACIKILNNKIQNDNLKLSYYIKPENRELNMENFTLSNKLIFGLNNEEATKEHIDRANICGELNIQASLDPNELNNQDDEEINLTPEQKTSILEKIYNTKHQSIVLLISHINGLVNIIIDAAEKKPNKEIILPEALNIQGLLYRPIKEYQQNIASLTKQHLLKSINIYAYKDKQAISDVIINQGKKFGWITAGSYYYLLSQSPINNLLNSAQAQETVENPLFSNAIIDTKKLDQAALGVTGLGIKPYVIALDNKQQYINNLFKPIKELIINDQLIKSINKVSQKQRNIIHQKLPDELQQHLDTNNPNIENIKQLLIEKHPNVKTYIESFFNLYEIAIKEVKTCFNSSHDPLISQAIFGNKLMQTAESFWMGITVSSLISKELADMFNDNQNYKSFLIGLLPITLLFSGIIWTIGATMSIYTPMVPYIIFIITALSWFLLVIESIVAAPIVAIGFIAPSQDELGKVAPALGIIANMFLKPTLMIIGLLMSTKLYGIMVKMINLGFQFSLSTLQSQSGTSMFSWIVIIILYSGFIITLVNKCYSLIYQLPDKILRWIGLTGEQTDVSGVKEIQQYVEQGTKQGIAPIEGGTTAAARSLQENIKAAGHARAAARDAQSTQQGGSSLEH